MEKAYKYLNRELRDGKGDTGGIAFIGETLADFLFEAFPNEDVGAMDMEKVNEALETCGIEKISTLDSELEELWEQLEDVPFDIGENGDLMLAEDWHIFPRHTAREDIWRWFDERHTKGVAYLLGVYEEDEPMATGYEAYTDRELYEMYHNMNYYEYELNIEMAKRVGLCDVYRWSSPEINDEYMDVIEEMLKKQM